ncbi:MAG: acyl carrier protein [Oligoflexia bacterium]|nr:acyl carrier protein [Oligoflexia bacterium]
MNVQSELNQIFCKVFNDDSIVISGNMTSANIDGWDSMSHINLILTVENSFKIQFSQKELMRQRNISDLIRDIEHKLQSH